MAFNAIIQTVKGVFLYQYESQSMSVISIKGLHCRAGTSGTGIIYLQKLSG
jgi:hypothetical protein